MIKKLTALIFAGVICFGLTVSVGAQPIEKIGEEVAAQGDSYSPRAVVIVRKHRMANGVRQYRRWNETHGYWVDPYWIDVK